MQPEGVWGVGATRIAAVMAGHNRTALTQACLESLRAQRLPGCTLDVFVPDAAGTDGTAETVPQRHPAARLLRGASHLYWNGGMRRALDEAIAGDYDYHLWMNHDTTLVDNSSFQHIGATRMHVDAALRLADHLEKQLADTGHDSDTAR